MRPRSIDDVPPRQADMASNCRPSAVLLRRCHARTQPLCATAELRSTSYDSMRALASGSRDLPGHQQPATRQQPVQGKVHDAGTPAVPQRGSGARVPRRSTAVPPARTALARLQDLERQAAYKNVPFAFPSKFPINTIATMRLLVALDNNFGSSGCSPQLWDASHGTTSQDASRFPQRHLLIRTASCMSTSPGSLLQRFMRRIGTAAST